MEPIGPIAKRRRTARPDLLKARVLLVIRELGPVTAETIADTVPVLSTDPVRIIRRKVRDLIMCDRIPIASSMQPPFGYFVVEPGSEEAEAYIMQLRGRIESICQRLARFREGAAERIQGVLFEEFGKQSGKGKVEMDKSPVEGESGNGQVAGGRGKGK